MKIALLSDIHGNHLALESVINEVRDAGISTLLICGDFVGYYYNVHKVLDLLSPFDVIACRGNHEDLFKEWLTGADNIKDKISNKYGGSFKIAEHNLTQKQKTWLLNLIHPVIYKINDKIICICHGSPWDLNLYLYDNTIGAYINTLEQLSCLYDVVVFGHSHYQFMKQIKSMIIVNPGSVGQPRSGKLINAAHVSARAQWAIIDMQDMNVHFHTTLYDAALLFKEIDKYDPSLDYLKTVLLKQ